MKLIQHYLSQNPCYKSGKQIEVKGLMLHSVGVNQPSAKVFLDTWNSPEYNAACVHGFIDANDGTIYQTLPWTMRGWHCGRSGNNTHIGVEMCEPKGIRYYRASSKFEVTGDISEVIKQVQTTYQAAVELFAYLCEQFKLNPLKSGVILSHHEGYLAGIASNHGDPEHLWTKSTLGLPYTMDIFRHAVDAEMKRRQNESENAYPKTPFMIQVSVPDLWVRSGPGFAYTKQDPEDPFTGIGVFTIVEVSGQFGKLKSGAGWVNLKNQGVKVL